MNKIAKFKKVSLDEFCGHLSLENSYREKESEILNDIKMPKRSTTGAAGYDFYSPYDIELPYGKSVVVPTGIRCKIDEGWALFMMPRSGLGFKTGVRLANTIGLIDADYYYADNEGHIMVKLTNNDGATRETLKLEKGKAFCQGVFLPFGITVDDENDIKKKRAGGLGSTDETFLDDFRDRH